MLALVIQATPSSSISICVVTRVAEGRPDYNFRVAGQTKFFVEVKAPSEPLDSGKHILQAKGYAWNTKQVCFVILTDFEEFRFYDASIKPDERKPDEGLLLKLKYADYAKNLEKLWEFSRERVAAGSLETMLPRDRRTQRLRIPVDKTFLEEMTGWREDLARNVYKNNPALTAKQLNEIVQRLLDRIVFIRIAEDRHIIEKRQLEDAVDEWKARGGKFHLFEWLNDLFHRINEDFNGEIFKPHLSESIKVDSDVLAKIIERLYPPKSPYRFDVIGVELLGSIYERYLGKTIRPTAKEVRVEEKPEVRKAGGVYYTDPAQEGERIVAFVLSDGDMPLDPKYFASPWRGQFNMKWEVSPLLAGVAPRVLKYFYDNATDMDSFVAAGSPGYRYIHFEPEPRGEIDAEQSAPYLDTSHLSIVSVINDNGGGLDEVIPLLELPEVDGVIYKAFSPYNRLHGQILWHNGKPAVAYKFLLWESHPDGSPQAVADAIAGMLSSPQTDPESYALINAHAWSFASIGGPVEAVKRTIDLLPPKTRVVTVDDFFALLKDNFASGLFPFAYLTELGSPLRFGP